jgi:hypothetical protein
MATADAPATTAISAPTAVSGGLACQRRPNRVPARAFAGGRAADDVESISGSFDVVIVNISISLDVDNVNTYL